MSKSHLRYSGGVLKEVSPRQNPSMTMAKRWRHLVKDLSMKHGTIEELQPRVVLRPINLGNLQMVRVVNTQRDNMLSVLPAANETVEQIHKESLAEHHQMRRQLGNLGIGDTPTFKSLGEKVVTQCFENLNSSSSRPQRQQDAEANSETIRMHLCRDVNVQCLLFKRFPIQFSSNNEILTMRFVPEEDKISYSHPYYLPQQKYAKMPSKDVEVQTEAINFTIETGPSSSGTKSLRITTHSSAIAKSSVEIGCLAKSSHTATISEMIKETQGELSALEKLPIPKTPNLETAPNAMKTIQQDPYKLGPSADSLFTLQMKNSDGSGTKKNVSSFTQCMTTRTDLLSSYINAKRDTKKASIESVPRSSFATPSQSPLKNESLFPSLRTPFMPLTVLQPKPAATPKPVLCIDNDSAKQLANYRTDKQSSRDKEFLDSEGMIDDNVDISGMDTDLADVISQLDKDVSVGIIKQKHGNITVTVPTMLNTNNAMSKSSHNFQGNRKVDKNKRRKVKTYKNTCNNHAQTDDVVFGHDDIDKSKIVIKMNEKETEKLKSVVQSSHAQTDDVVFGHDDIDKSKIVMKIIEKETEKLKSRVQSSHVEPKERHEKESEVESNSQNVGKSRSIIDYLTESRIAKINELKAKLGMNENITHRTAKHRNVTDSEVDFGAKKPDNNESFDLHQNVFSLLECNDMNNTDAIDGKSSENKFLKSRKSSDLGFFDAASAIVGINKELTASKNNHTHQTLCVDHACIMYTNEFNNAVANNDYSKLQSLLQKLKCAKQPFRKQILQEAANTFAAEPNFNMEWESTLEMEYKNFVIGGQKFLSKMSWCERLVHAATYTPTLLLMCLQMLLRGRNIAKESDLKKVYLKLSLILHLLSDGLFLEYDFDEEYEENNGEKIDTEESQAAERATCSKKRKLSEDSVEAIYDDGLEDNGHHDEPHKSKETNLKNIPGGGIGVSPAKSPKITNIMENDRCYSERIPFASKSDSQIHPMSCVLQTQLHPDELVMRNEAIVVIDEDMTENIDNKNDDKVKKAPPGNLSLEEKIANVSDWFSKTFTTCDIGKKRFVANLKEMIGNNKNFKLTYFLTDVDKSEKGMYICGPVDLNEKMAKKISSKEDTALQMHLTKSNTLSDLDAIIKNDIEGLENKEKCAERKSGSLLSDVCVFKVSIPVSQSTEFKMSAQKNTMIDHQKVLEMFHHDCSNFLSNMKLELQHKFKIECPFCAELCENERLFTALTEYERHFRHVHTSKINVGGHLSRYIYYDTLELFEAKNLWIDNPCSSTLPQVFVCYVCKYATTKRYSYYSHLLRHRNVATFYVCYQCKTSFHSYPTLFSHYESEHDIKVICPNPPSFTVELPEDATMHPDGTSKDFISGPTFRRNIMKKKEVHELLETMVMKHPTMEVFLENADKMSPQYKEKFYEVKNSIWKILTKTKVQLFHDAKTNLRAKQLLQLREKCDSNAEKMKVTQVTCLVCHVVFKTQFDKITHHFDEHVFAHISRNEKDRLKKVLDEPLRCGNCNEKLRSKFDLYIHQYSEHNDKNVHVLNHSPDRLSVLGKRKVTISQKRYEFLKRFGHTNDIRLWIKYLPEELIYCDKCDKKFVPSNYTGFVKHQVQAHGIVMPYNCHRCGKGFDNEAVFNKHRCKKKPNGGKICKQAANVTQTTEGKVCERCGKVVKTEVGLKCHLKSCGLSGKAIHTCPRCSKTFGLFAVYKEHVVNVNCTNDSNFEPVDEFVSGNTIRLKRCSRCDRRFTNTADYKQHMDTVNCNNDPKFRQGHRRKRKPYIDFCPRCSKRFHSSRGLTRHLKTVNCTDDPAFVPVPTKEVQVARHCPRCGKNIYSEMIYKRHVNIVNCTNAPDFVPRFDHTAAFNFKWDCPKCGKSFTKRISARDHRNKVNCLKDPNFIPRRPSSQITQCRQILKSPAEDRQNKTSSLNEGTKTGENVSTSLTAKQFGNNYSNLDVCTSNVDNLDAVNVDTMTTIDGSNTPSARLNFFRETDFGQDMLADVATDVSCSLPTSAVISLHSEQDKCISANVQQSNASTPVSQIFKTSNIQASETKHSVAQHFHSKEVSSSYGIATCNVEPSTLYGANSVGNIPMSEAELQSSSNPVSTCDIVPTSIMSVDNMLMNQAELEASTQSIDNASRYTKLEFSSVFTEGSEIIVPPGFSLVQGEDEQFYLIPLDIAQEN